MSLQIPKYINPPDCELYNKSTTLYGLSFAAKAIKEKAFAYVTEGYMDVVSPHRIGLTNTVATCGTAFTTQQMQLLKKYTSHLVLWRDNDSAGTTSVNRSLPELLKHGFKVDQAVYEGHDPDEWCLAQTVTDAAAVIGPSTTDAVMFRCKQLWQDAGEDIHKRAEAKQVILELLACIENDFTREGYLTGIVSLFKWKLTEVKKQFEKIVDTTATANTTPEEDEDAIKLPEWLNEEQKEDFLQNGYVKVRRSHNGKPMVGYYGFNAAGKVQITNFLMKPLFHVYAGVESRYLIEIDNGYRRGVLDIPAKIIPSIDQFQGCTVAEGNFVIHGAKSQWLRIASDLLQNFPRCIELNTLGWQNFGFFAFVNKIYIPGEGLKELDNWGIIQHNTGEEKENFLIPASCEAYRQLQRTGDDPYENDRYLTYKQSPINFSTWSAQMARVYGQKGVVGIAYAILTLFRDLVFEVDNNCPHLYAFGEPSSGKSKWAESITALFYFKRSAFNLNSGTDFAFFNYMQRYNNAVAHLNEFEIEVIKPEWFQAIKGIYDGEGRERGKGGSKNRTEVMRVRSTLILTGQKLVTADDNSVVTRSLIEPFSTREDITEEDKKAYDQLKEWEAKGLSSMLVELLVHRPYLQTHYKQHFDELLSQWRKQREQTGQLNQRIVQNYAHLATGYNIISRHMQLPQKAEDFTEYCYKQAIKWSSFIRSSDTLSEFWRTLEFLADQHDVNEGWDYTIEEVLQVKVRTPPGDVNFQQPTKILFLRLNSVHKLFQTTYRQRSGKEAMSIENLLHYFSSRKYYLGNIKSKLFKRYVTRDEVVKQSNGLSGPATARIETRKHEEKKEASCYAFLYDDLGISLENFSEDEIQKDLPF